MNAGVALAFLGQKMTGYKNLKLVAASNGAPLGFKNPKISISGPTMSVSVEVLLATAIYFIPISISISQVQSEA